jgi:transcriptional regulator with GAF, ATPase, and Fis domain
VLYKSAMPLTLVALHGPLAGATLPLGEGDVTVGRDDSNHLALSDQSVSPRHCVLACGADAVTIRDLDEQNPTFVNGLPSGERPAGDGDRLQIGDSLFVISRSREGERRPAATVQLSQATESAQAAVVRRREDVFAQARLLPGATPARLAHDLAALIRISATISAVRGLVALERPLLELIADVIPARRGAVILCGRGHDIASTVAWTRGEPDARPVQINSATVDRVLGELVGILSFEPAEDAPEGSGRTPRPERSMLAVPLVAFEKPMGVIVLETEKPEAFDEGHLLLLMALAGTSATALAHARQVEWLAGENRRLKAEIDVDHNMVGQSPVMREVYKRIAKVAPTESTVLIGGESGTGKELVARAIHRNSPRAERPFIAINCAAITETLLETEMFGHEKGAFTGAIAHKKGKLEMAEGGTVFLDEIGELSPALQAKMLRVLQEREFERVGGTRSVRVDFRLIAATNRDLDVAIASGQFRRDLYYRLNVVSLSMPPLRERRGDIPLLASTFARRQGDKAGRAISGFTAEALACLTAHDWPGNVRELQNAVEHAIVLGSTPFILPDDLPDAIAEARPASTSRSSELGSFHDAIKQAKRDLIIRAVDRSEGNCNAAARLLGLHPNYLHRLIKNLQLKPALKDSGPRY